MLIDGAIFMRTHAVAPRVFRSVYSFCLSGVHTVHMQLTSELIVLIK